MLTKACTVGCGTVLCVSDFSCNLVLPYVRLLGQICNPLVQVRNHVLTTWRADVSKYAAVDQCHLRLSIFRVMIVAHCASHCA